MCNVRILLAVLIVHSGSRRRVTALKLVETDIRRANKKAVAVYKTTPQGLRINL